MTDARPVTLCIINFNGADRLDQVLSAAGRSTLEFAEIVVVDDASTDGSIALLRERHPRVRILAQERNRGPGAARNARRYGFVAALTGGLIGPPGAPRDYAGSLDGTPVFLGSSDVDPHIPLERVQESTAAVQNLGGDVTERIYPNMGHTINEDEIAIVNAIMEEVLNH